MYKKTSMAILATAMMCSAFAQSTLEDVDARLIEHFGSDHVLHLQQNAPNLLAHYTYYLDNAVEIMEINEKDISNLPLAAELEPKEGTLNTISLVDQLAANNFNPLAFELEQKTLEYTYYRIGNGNLVLAVLPSTIYNKNYDEFRGATYE